MGGGAGGAAARAGGLGRALTEVLRAAKVDGDGRATLFGLRTESPAVDERLDRALAVLAAAFPNDVVASRHVPPDAGPVVRARSEEVLPRDVAFRLGALFACSGDELLVAHLEHVGSDAALAVWRLHGAFSDEERAVAEAIAELADR